MNEKDFQDSLQELLEQYGVYDPGHEHGLGKEHGARCRTYDEAGVMSTNHGLVVRLDNDQEFMITVVAKKRRY